MIAVRSLLFRSQRAAILMLAPILALAGSGVRAVAQTPPDELTRSQVRKFNSDSEMVEGAFPGMLVIPKTPPTYRDEKYQKPYTLACHVYIAVPASDGGETKYERRFLVCAADPDSLDFAKSVARMLLLLYGERHERLRDDHSLSNPTVNVWLTERVESGLSPDTGGEQFQNQIYLYNIHNQRSEVEWAREIAHEYGHYSLPAVSGFTAPEEWANGVLGERLYLKWIREDLRSGKLKPEEVPIVSPAQLDDYFIRSIWPHIRRIMREGVDAQILARPKADGMDYYTGLVMYLDTVYGTSALVDAIVDTRSAPNKVSPKAVDFLAAIRTSLRDEKELALNLPALGDAEKEQTIFIYLPAGKWSVSMQGSTRSWRITNDAAAGIVSGGSAVTARKGSWRPLTYVRSGDSSAARLILRRRG